MQQPGSLANVAPPSSEMDALRRELQDVKRQIAELRTARSGEAMVIAKSPGLLVKNGAPVTIQDGATVSINDGGELDMNDASAVNLNDGSFLWIYDGGSLIMQTPAGHTVVQAQRIDIPDGSGRKQQVFVLGRDDGSLAFALADLGTTPGHSHQQNWALYDRATNILFAEDTDSGVGLARPYLSLGPFMSNSYPTDTTTSGSFVTLQTLVGFKQHPKVWVQILGRSDDGTTTGEIRVIDQDGHVIGPVQTVTAGAYAYYNIGPAVLPGAHELAISLNIQARRTAGTGAIGVRGIAAWGQQT